MTRRRLVLDALALPAARAARADSPNLEEATLADLKVPPLGEIRLPSGSRLVPAKPVARLRKGEPSAQIRASPGYTLLRLPLTK